jgi:cysteine desulfurase / selenocysteine lyase
MQTATSSYRDQFVGLDYLTPTLGGRLSPYTNLDNAASTPALKTVDQAVQGFLQFYSSVHRGTGFKSQLSTHVFEASRHKVIEFVGGNPAEHVCIYGKNTTEMTNRLALRFPFTAQRNLVLVSSMEHHSNDLPWRHAAQVIHIANLPDGRLDEADFDRLLAEYRDLVALVAITGASNVTGFINPVHRLAEKAHAAGAQILVDCAQLAPHRAVNMLPLSDPAHLDYVVISAHKLYAPFGTGALVGRKDTFAQGEPDHRGGGQVEFVGLDTVYWSGAPERDEAGSPNTVGAVALAAALTKLQAIGMEQVARHEAELTGYLLTRLREVPGVLVFGEPDPARAAERLGVVPIQLEGLSHFLVAAILGFEFNIGVRNGCFCAHPYLMHLLHVPEEEALAVRSRILLNDRREVPGLVRISFGLYNDFSDVDRLIEALKAIRKGEYQGTYLQDPRSGEYHPLEWQLNYADFFSFGKE